ncbi:MAG TPA: hypothetical protein VIQ52_18300 [Arthrobacter sp.]
MATGGQIARGFRNDGQLEAILQYIKPGDLFLLKMGINDTAAKNATTEAEFKEIMREMVRQVAAAGATPALITPQGRATDFVDGVHSSATRCTPTVPARRTGPPGVRRSRPPRPLTPAERPRILREI